MTAARVVQLCLLRDPAGRPPDELLRAWRTLTLIAEAAARAGSQVDVLQTSAHHDTRVRDGIPYHFGPWTAAAVRRPTPRWRRP
ncbi:hypothetical protein ACFJIX_16345 [Roseateles sp. UC29_93]|uniref:hypothetical protein n=1 Tax=Roseateles sp. UC29_93 TaxID=3350177 RepID=UPI00366BDBB2